MTVVTATRQKPSYLRTVQERAHARWNQLEADPELAGPWKLLFAQVQSPRHVLSELLQNADDAGAPSASAKVENGVFLFEHNGEDFDEAQFSSLCRFGFSNKRKLHTIGFRGIGFKSLFSLGKTVEVLTPTLAVRFQKCRFTEPIWIEGAPPCRNTLIRVAIQDESRALELQANLDEWARSAVSLAFFNCITELVIGGTVIQRRRLGSGPVPGSEVLEITDTSAETLYLFRSPEEPFPDEAVEEISAERNLDDLNLHPCRVELVAGLGSDSRLYVVLPTDVKPGVPFSCNAPFIQDPARTGLKAPGTSPTNRWLLRRTGRLAAHAMREWLANGELPLAERANAYRLVPISPGRSDTIGDDCAREISQAFADATADIPVLLTADGTLATPNTCLAPPLPLYSVWDARQLLDCFGIDEQHVLSGDVEAAGRYALQQRGWISPLPASQALERLRSGERPPNPKGWDRLLNLWAFVRNTVQYDYGGQARRTIRMVPAEGQEVLFTAEEVVRLAANWKLANDHDWEFLSGFMVAVDGKWLAWLGNDTTQASESDGSPLRRARDTLRAIGLETATPADTVLARAGRSLFRQPQVNLADAIRLTHIMAALKVRACDEFQYYTRDGRLRRLSHGLIWGGREEIDCLVPQSWAAAHLLDDHYARGSASCSREAWGEWAHSEKSGLKAAIYPQKTSQGVWGKWNVARFLRARHVAPPSEYPYKRDRFCVLDYDFEPKVLEHLEEISESDPGVWSRVLILLLRDASLACLNQVKAIVRQHGNTHSEMVKCGDIPAAWLVRFQGLRCLPDDHGILREPAELLMRTPSTEPLMHVEPFVAAEYDTPANQPLLKLLGVRDTPSGPDKLLDRIRALATVEAPPVHEVCKWYEALDRLLSRSQSRDLSEARAAFRKGRLILTEENEWATVEEAFLVANEEDVPGAPLVHSSARELTMWPRLGVAERPTVDLVIRWLSGVESGKKLEGQDLKRVRALITRHPVQIWDQCGHWLSLDNAWTPTANLRYRVTMRGLTKFGDLFPTFKARTANLQMLSADVCDSHPFAAVKNLGTEIAYQVTERQHDLPPAVQKPWVAALANALGRAKLDPDHADRVRATAKRLHATVWQAFQTLCITPYIEGTPAGQAQSPDVFWENGVLYVRDWPLVRVFDALVAEIARPFGLARIAEVVKTCVDRDASFVNEYIAETLGFDDDLPVDASEPPEGATAGTDDGAPCVGTKEANPPEGATGEPAPTSEAGTGAAGLPPEDDGEDTDPFMWPPTAPVPKPPSAVPSPSLIFRFARGHGYRWDDARQRYVHPDGLWLQKCEGSFNWERYSSCGDVVCRYRVSKQCLANDGIEVAADLWELMKKYPSETALVLEDVDGKPHELKGNELVEMVNSGTLKLFPANYRLRLAMPA